MRLADVESGRNNNLNLIRLVLASMVILSHSYVLRGDYAHEPMHALLRWGDMGESAVFAFFFVSGYLILKSALRWSTPEQYVAARALRIFPGLMVAVLLCTFILGPLMSTSSMREYLESPMTRSFFSEAWLHRTQNPLPGVFEHNPIPSIVDGTIWTLPAEWTMYMVTLGAGLAIRWKKTVAMMRKRSWITLVGSALLTWQMMPIPWDFARIWMFCFLLGSSCYLLRRRIPLSIPMALIIFAADLVVIRFGPPHVGAMLFPMSLCYVVLTLGFHPVVHVAWFHRLGDYSYGLYILGWPWQQMFVLHTPGPMSLFGISYALALTAAVLSWHFIEQPCLALKNRVPKAKLPVSQYAEWEHATEVLNAQVTLVCSSQTRILVEKELPR
jgi:peptidoglycan/LPS O-acetylase OafA/YrhL